MARTPPGYYLHLVAWAQIGVLMRVYMAELFGSACPSVHWAPCLTSPGTRWGGAYFTDLPANILGSFLMGLFVSSDVLSNSLRHTLTVEAPMAILPTWSPLQEHMAFQVGLRTGLCGSLTTFASWVTQMVIMFVGRLPGALHHSQWVEALGGLLVGVLAASGALVLGQHMALLIYHKLNPGAFIPFGSPAPEQAKLEGSTTPAQPLGDGVQEEEDGGSGDGSAYRRGAVSSGSMRAPSLGRLRSVSSVREGRTTTVVVVQECDEEQPQPVPVPAAAAAAAGAAGAAAGSAIDGQQLPKQGGSVELASRQHQPDGTAAAAAAAAAQQQVAAASNGAVPLVSPFAPSAAHQHTSSLGQQSSSSQHSGQYRRGSGGVRSSASLPLTVPVVEEVDEVEEPSFTLSQLMVDAFAVVTIAVLTGISLWRMIQGPLGGLVNENAPFAQEWFWWAIVFGPLGCYLRYYLSRFNGRLPGDWKWFPLGTFTANIAACVIDYVMKVLLLRHTNEVAMAVLAGVVGGVGGCLSTVSTWVVEIQRMLLSFPRTYHGYAYIFTSLVTAVVLGLIIYGIPVWTMAV